METLSIVSERLEALEQRKPSPAPSESGNSDRKPRAGEHEKHDEDCKASKPSPMAWQRECLKERSSLLRPDKEGTQL